MARIEHTVFLGLDVGKEDHHACGLSPEGHQVHDKALPQDEKRLRELFATLVRLGPVAVLGPRVADPAVSELLPGSVARPGSAQPVSSNCTVAKPRAP